MWAVRNLFPIDFCPSCVALTPYLRKAEQVSYLQGRNASRISSTGSLWLLQIRAADFAGTVCLHRPNPGCTGG